MSKTQDRIAGNILSSLLLVAMLGFMAVLLYTKMIPPVYMGLIGAFLLVLFILCRLLTLRIRKAVRFTIGTILILILIIGLCIGGFYLIKTVNAIDTITGVNTQTAVEAVYVKAEDPAENLRDASTYSFGILRELDRDHTNAALDQLKLEIGSDFEVIEYDTLSDVADSLKEEGHAVLINQAYLDVITQMDGYTDFENTVKEIASKKVEIVVERNVPEVSAPGEPANEVTESTTDTAEEPAGQEKAEAASTEDKKEARVYTVYISGVDTRGELVSTSRSDVNIIATINLDTRQVLLVSTPRDYYVPLSISNGVPDKLTHAGIYGINVCCDTLGMLYDIKVNYYFRLNFVGFVQLIDALGGVTVISDYTFDSGNIQGYHFEKGENYINSDAALAFVRERYAFSEGDRQRGRNQMAVIQAVIRKCMSPDVLKNYMSVLSKAAGSFETNVPYDLIASLVKEQLTSNGNWNILTYSVDGAGDTRKPYSMSSNAYVMIPDQTTVDKAKELMSRVRNGEILTQDEINQ